jgi:hypothetical protein
MEANKRFKKDVYIDVIYKLCFKLKKKQKWNTINIDFMIFLIGIPIGISYLIYRWIKKENLIKNTDC